jgi:DNA-binding transcriptional LysR family regulator
MTKGAELLGISQSAASAAIRALEQQNQVQLFHRVGRNIELSSAGNRFLPEAKAVIERAALALLVLENASDSMVGSLSIAASQTIASYWLPRRLAAFHELHPSVRLDVMIGNTREVESRVLDGRADLGLVEGRTRSDVLVRTRVDLDRLVLVASHSFAAKLPVDGPDLSAMRWIVRENGSGTREALEDAASREGLSMDQLQISLVLPNNEAIRQAVEAGAGAALISALVVGTSIADGRLQTLPFEAPEREFALISHRDRLPTLAQKALKAHLHGR